MRYRTVHGFVFVLAILTWLIPASSKGQSNSNPHAIKPYLTGNINISSQSWGICQNSTTQLIYFANTQGLVEFNGLSSRIWKHPEQKTIRSIQIDATGKIFTGSFEDFGYWTTEQNGNLTYHSLSNKITTPQNDEIWKIYLQHGKVYFQSFTSIYIYDYKTVKRIAAPTIILFMFPTADDFIVQGLSEGLYQLKKEEFTLIPGSQIFKESKVHAIIPTGNKTFLICTDSKGIYKYDGTAFKPFTSEVSSFLSYYNCNAGIQVNDTLFAFGTILNGIVFSNNKGQIIRQYNYSNGLKNNTVLSIYRDNLKGIWVGLDEGAGYLGIENPFTPYFNPTGTLGTIYTVLRDADNLYIGTNHGLFIASISEINNSYSFSDIQMIPGSQGQVWTLIKHKGQIFCGHNEGTFLVKGTRMQKISNVTGCWTIKPYADKLVEGTYTGLVMLGQNGENWQIHHRIAGYFEPTRHIEVDYLGYIWAAHPQRGVYKLELNETMDTISKSEFYQSASRSESNFDVYSINNTIVFTSSNLLYRYNYDQKRIELFSSLNKSLLEYAQAKQIIPFHKNEYWFILPNKLALFSISKDFNATKKFELLSRNAEITSRDINILPLALNTILLPDNNLFSVCDLSLATKRNLQIKPTITRLEFSGKNKTRTFSTQKVNTISIEYATNNLTIWFAFPAGIEQVEKNFYYKLDELDNGWHKTTLDNITYLNLKHGSYNFRIKTETGDDAAMVKFTIKKPWYMTWYAYILYIAVVVSLTLLFKRIFTVDVRRRNQLREYALSQNRLESELSIKTNEQMLTMRFLMQKNEILTQLQEKIQLLKNDSSKYPVKYIRDIEKVITEGLDLQTEEWKGAMNNLKLSEQGFFKELKEKNPNLTPHDLRLCSYLRMNFTTREIARLLNISTRGVEIGRYRLRRKLGLTHDENLTEFLMSFSPEKE